MNLDIREKIAGHVGNDEFVASLQHFHGRFQEFRERLPVIPLSYSRTCLLATPHYEVVAMHWSPGSVTPIHDHGSSRCWVLMLEGALDVENFERTDDGSNVVELRDMGTLTVGRGELDFRNGPRELHRVNNKGSESAYSLQLYAGPVTRYTIVDNHSSEGRIVEATYDLVLALDAAR